MPATPAALFPTLTTGTVAFYPVTRQREFVTRVVRYVDDSEQRYLVRLSLARFVLEFDHLSTADRDTLRQFWESKRGRFDHTWDFDFDGQLYTGLMFDHDVWQEADSGACSHRVTLRLRQRG